MATKSATSARVGRVLLVIGIVIAVVAVASVVVLMWYFSLPIDHGSLSNDTKVRGGLLLTEDTVSEGGVFLAIPAGILLVASCFLFPGYFMSRGRMGLSTSNRVGGSIVANYAVVPARTHVLWLLVAVLFWILLLVVPLISAGAGGWPMGVESDARDYVFVLCGMYGGLAAGIAGLMAVSLVKKQHYLSMQRSSDPRLQGDEAASPFWRWFSYRWRIDGWLAMIGGGLAGVSVMPAVLGSPLICAILLVIALALLVAAVAAARQYGRAGEGLGSAEGFA
jgi:uncharacterized membrane protein